MPEQDVFRAERARLATRKIFGPLDATWTRRKPLRATPLQQLLDPGQALLETATPLQSTSQLAPTLPEWNALQTHGPVVEFSFPPPSRGISSGGEALTTLDESVVAALIRALYDALPDDLGAANVWDLPETTASGNIIGRHAPVSATGVQSVPTEAAQEKVQGTPALSPQPRQYLRGVPDPETVRVTRQSLAELPLNLPSDEMGTPLSARELLGYGEAYFLRAQSALWAWRTHRQANLQLHTDGPPMQGRNVLVEQRLGPLTLLLGERVTRLTESERHWGFTLGSLRDQVFRSQETFLVEWQDDDAVIFSFESRQQIALPNLGLLGPVHSAVRRVITQGYLKNMREMTADAEGYEQ